MGGTLQVESRPGKGSEFRLRLPLPCEELAVTRPAPPGPVAIFTHNAFLAHELREMLLAWEIDAPWLASPQELRSWLEEGAQTACIIADQTMDEAEAHLHDLRRPCRLLWLCPPDMPSQWQQGLAENESWLVGLPRAEDVALWLEGGRPAHSAARESAKPERHRGRCLVVDDNDINRRLIVLLLDQYGLTPDEAQDGAEAVMLCREKRYDLIFMDIHMPAMDGMEATRLIRQAEQHGRHTPVVALTANAFPGDLERFRTAGMDDVLTKPMKEEQLVTILHRWLPDSPAPADRAEEEETMEQESLPVLDEAAGLSTAYGKRELWLKVLGMLVEGLPATLAQLDAAWQGQDWDEVYHVAHRLNGSAVYCGTPRLRAAAAALESAGRRREAEEIGRCLAHLKQEAGRLMEHDGLPIIRNGAE
jgi:CheY-like chemotaxis protein/HPt (histidine-containing phosphotransfer) domain-containing protein